MYLNIFLEKNKVLNKFKYLEVGRVNFFQFDTADVLEQSEFKNSMDLSE
jgi:hypothetical protein